MKIKTASFYCIALAFLFLASSCSVEKRHYTKGFYVSNKSTKGNIIPAEHKKETNTTATINEIVLPKKEVISKTNQKILLASSVKKTITLIKTYLVEGCDTLIMKNGDLILCKVTEISQAEIKYKRCDNLAGPTIVVHAYDVFAISYPNGKQDVISATKPQSNKTYNTIGKPESSTFETRETKSYKKVINQPALFSFISAMLAAISLIGCIAILYIYLLGAIATASAAIYFIYFIAAFGLIALILGIVGLIEIRKNKDLYKGSAFAKTGMIVGAILFGIALFVIGILALAGII